MNAMVIMLDTDVILDYLISRKPFTDTAERILRLCFDEKSKGYIAAHSITNIFYILRKRYSTTERKKMLLELCEFIEVDKKKKEQVIDALLNEEFSDIEDRLQVECARVVNADYVITRNIEDFSLSPIPAIQPTDFLTMISGKEQGTVSNEK
jgi:predicted nucleic acid-binding protein